MNDLEARWSSIDIPSAALQGTEIRPGCGVWLSIDREGHRCVLLQNDSPKPAKTSLFETKGVAAFVEDLEVAGAATSSWVVVVCRDARYWEPFLAFAESLNQELAEKNDDNISIVLRVLRRWRWLWTVDPSGLTRDTALGLIGELWFLLQWAGISKGLTSWTGPDGKLHDFAGGGVSVEVKTSLSSGLKGPVHTISNLQQLSAPAQGTGTLYLFSFVVSPDQSAGNTLSKLVEVGIRALENDPYKQDLFLQKLSLVGWASPLAKELDFPFRVVSEQLYEVDNSFPALTEGSFLNGVPHAVTAVSYDLDISACLDWRVAVTASEGKKLVVGLTDVD